MTDPGHHALHRRLAALNRAATLLARCPFCAGEARLVCEPAWGGMPEHHLVLCSGCGARTPPIPSLSFNWEERRLVAQDAARIATELWNTRTA